MRGGFARHAPAFGLSWRPARRATAAGWNTTLNGPEVPEVHFGRGDFKGTSSFLLLVVMPGATNSVLVPSSKALCSK